jgi:hypothetical protein
MRHAALWVAALAVCAVGAARMPEVYAKEPKAKAPKAKPKPKAKECVRLVETRVDDDHMTLELVNECTVVRACTIRWSVTCDGGAPDEQERQADLPAGGSEVWPVSAAHCGDAGFVISPPRWSCARATPAAAAR